MLPQNRLYEILIRVCMVEKLSVQHDDYDYDDEFWWGNLRERDQLEDTGVDGSYYSGPSRSEMRRHGLDCSGSG
jgi:hypothetical protein